MEIVLSILFLVTERFGHPPSSVGCQVYFLAEVDAGDPLRSHFYPSIGKEKSHSRELIYFKSSICYQLALRLYAHNMHSGGIV